MKGFSFFSGLRMMNGWAGLGMFFSAMPGRMDGMMHRDGVFVCTFDECFGLFLAYLPACSVLLACLPRDQHELRL